MEGAEHLESMRNIYTKVEMLLTACLMTEVFEGCNTEELMTLEFMRVVLY